MMKQSPQTATEEIPRILVWTLTGPDFPSGSPAILAALLDHLPEGRLEVVCEDFVGREGKRLRRFHHPVRRYLLPGFLWPFRRGSRIRNALGYLCAPCLLLYGLWRILRFRPGCLLTVYHQPFWIFTSYLLSKLTSVPVVYYVHDPYREAAEHRGGLGARFARWLEPRSLRHGSVWVLSAAAADQYARRYGVTAHVLPHIAGHEAIPPRQSASGSEKTERVIGFAGTIYDNNRDLMTQLAVAVEGEPGLRLRAWTPASAEVLAACGLEGPRIEICFESDYGRLLKQLAQCDLLYLPLSFGDTPTLPADSLRYAFPTKVVDYCLAGGEILVHCPADYATARFFADHQAGHLLTEDSPGALERWLTRWLGGEIESKPGLEAARAAFDGVCNRDLFQRFLRQAISRSAEKP